MPPASIIALMQAPLRLPRLQRPPRLPRIVVTLGVAALIQWILWLLAANDMAVPPSSWIDTEPVRAFAAPFSNHAPACRYLLAGMSAFAPFAPAMTLIKALSLLGGGALALAVRHLMIRLGTPDANRAAALVFVLPSVAADAGLLGQCDAIWSAALIMALTAALERRHVTMLAWCGLALGFNAEAVLAAPFFLALLIYRRVPSRLWPIIPAIFAATMLPAWAIGGPPAALATITLGDADISANLSHGAPNIWMIVQYLPLGLPLLGLAAATAIGAITAYTAYFSARPLGDRALVGASLLCVLVTAGLLPGMNEQSFFLADILALVLALVFRDRGSWRIAILVQTGSGLTLLGYFIDVDACAMLGAICMILATIELARLLLKPAANDNPMLAQTA